MNDLFFFSLQGTKPSSVDDDLSSKQGDIIILYESDQAHELE